MAINAIRAIPLSSFDTNTLTGNYDVLTSGLPQACFLLRIVNDSNRDITISYDGATSHDYVVAGTHVEYNAQANNQPSAHVSLFQKGQAIHIMGTVGGTGYIYLAGYYV